MMHNLYLSETLTQSAIEYAAMKTGQFQMHILDIGRHPWAGLCLIIGVNKLRSTSEKYVLVLDQRGYAEENVRFDLINIRNKVN